VIGERFYNSEHKAFHETVHRFVENELLPHRKEWEAAGTVPREVWRKAGEAGLLCCDVPEEYGGVGGDFMYNVIVNEGMTRAGGGGPALAGHSDTAVPYILRYGSEALKREWLPKAVSGEAIFAVAMTEPHAGSDLQAMRTRAVRDGDEYVITGQKVYISNAQQAHAVVLACKTDQQARGNGISLILVDMDSPGLVRGGLMEKIGRRAQDTLELFFDEVRVPVSNLIGEENAGFGYLKSMLAQERLSSAVRAMAVTNLTLDWTRDYVKDRDAFGKKVAAFQNTQFEMADVWSHARVHQVFLEDCIEKHLREALTVTDAAIAKLRVTELEGMVIDRCLQFFGGAGYMWESPIARAYADARVNRISAGSNHILKMLIGREFLG